MERSPKGGHTPSVPARLGTVPAWGGHPARTGGFGDRWGRCSAGRGGDTEDGAGGLRCSAKERRPPPGRGAPEPPAPPAGAHLPGAGHRGAVDLEGAHGAIAAAPSAQPGGGRQRRRDGGRSGSPAAARHVTAGANGAGGPGHAASAGPAPGHRPDRAGSRRDRSHRAPTPVPLPPGTGSHRHQPNGTGTAPTEHRPDGHGQPPVPLPTGTGESPVPLPPGTGSSPRPSPGAPPSPPSTASHEWVRAALFDTPNTRYKQALRQRMVQRHGAQTGPGTTRGTGRGHGPVPLAGVFCSKRPKISPAAAANSTGDHPLGQRGSAVQEDGVRTQDLGQGRQQLRWFQPQ